MAKKILKIAGICLGVVLALAAGLIGWLTIREYKPAAVEEGEVGTWRNYVNPLSSGDGLPLPAVGDSLTILSQNTGYCGLGADSDFFMDGGKDVAPTREQASTNQEGLIQQFLAQNADVYFLQEVDVNSSRTGGEDQSAHYRTILDSYSSSHALNYSCDFVPYPLPPIGKVHSVLQTMSAVLSRIHL